MSKPTRDQKIAVGLAALVLPGCLVVGGIIAAIVLIIAIAVATS